MSDNLCNYRSRTVPPAQLDAPTVTGVGVTIPFVRLPDIDETEHGDFDMQYHQTADGRLWLSIDGQASLPVNALDIIAAKDAEIERLRASLDKEATDETEHGTAPGDPLIVTANNAPDAVAEALHRMFSAAWWREFQKVVSE